ncbi:septal ring lytic transglycosylase RlpA family protein [Halomonas piscis]|uniref:Endolytic peptidoglycan transglycosylase RlpA n=1 Tax=Halomonas piscis TaxID=3031727 RepID=A0ABY9YYK8_9GAMM|nr:septal ring lytic transglycosylase RlpA family protein [Halomonas piscis]WNK19138.1 septal ring lytic transglycosylase RlpA family protein [Halomonas piscis]
MRSCFAVWPAAVPPRLILSTAVVCALLALAGCAGQSPRPSAGAADESAAADKSVKADSGGRYAMSADAYPLDPPDVSDVPDAVPRVEPRSRAGNRSSYTVWGKKYRVLPDARGYSKTGTASWYGKKFHGYATSSGEIYDMYRMSAAHRSLPLPTFARVTREGTDKSVIVRVNDRGPFHSERVIDLSYAAASRLGITDDGTGRVRVEAIDPEQWLAQQGEAAPEAAANTSSNRPTSPRRPPARQTPADSTEPGPAGSGAYWQVAALESRPGAQKLKRRLEGELGEDVRIDPGDGIYRVQVGPVIAEGDDGALREALRRAGFPRAFIVR